mgnify:FL=1
MSDVTTAPSLSPSVNADVRSSIDNSRRTRCEVWTRVMGYHRPTSSFNTGKVGEFSERRFFNEMSESDIDSSCTARARPRA